MKAADYDYLMQANLARVFNERDAEKRLAALSELYADNAVLNEPNASVTGHASISHAVSELLASLPDDFRFSPLGPALGHHDLGRLRWRAGPPNGPAAVTGMDVARFEGGRIHTLFVFIEPAE